MPFSPPPSTLPTPWQTRKVGAVEKGRYADIIAIRGNPLDDVTILEHVSFVLKGGTVYRNDITK